jgi:hypothetical protein
VALMMLGRRLDSGRFTLEVTSPQLLVSEVISLVEQGDPAAVVIGGLVGAGEGVAIGLVKRLRARFPDLPIVLGLWGMTAAAAAAMRKGTLLGAADQLAVTLSDACAQLQSLWPFHHAASIAIPAISVAASGAARAPVNRH